MDKNIKIAGVSLIEVMISMVLIALLLIAVVSIFPRMASHRKGIQESDIAKAIAAETVEYLQMLSADDDYGCGNGDGFPDLDDDYKTRKVGAVDYTIIWYMSSNTACASGADFYPIEVKVTWTKQGKPHNITVSGTVQ